MAVNVDQLPSWAQKQILAKIAASEKEKAEKSAALAQTKKPNKYHNTPTTSVGEEGKEIKFDSKREAAHFDELMLLLRAGVISDLRLQQDFTLQEAYTLPNGNRVRAIRYKADFTYYDQNGKLVVEDVKGGNATKTRVYQIKKKMLLEKFGIEIKEVE